MTLPLVPARAHGGFPSTTEAGAVRRDRTGRGGPGVAPTPAPGTGLNGDDIHPVRTYEAEAHPQPWNERAMLPVSMDIRTDQGHLGKVS